MCTPFDLWENVKKPSARHRDDVTCRSDWLKH
jgi:hypothetical protein